ncbi:MAG: stage II sporulation protein M [Lachnospiraceae bacterium]|nr:stage II sporulation protein M [Lachnospiraceae bacterium]
MKLKFNINKKRQILIIAVCLFFMAGIVVGSIFARGLFGEKIMDILPESSFENGKMSFLPLNEAFLKNVFFSAVIWFCGFASFGVVFIAGIIFLKAMSYGYAVSIVIRAKGLGFAALAFLPQAIIIVPVYILMACVAISYIKEKNFNKIPIKRLKREKSRMFTEYVIIFASAAILIFLASLIESCFVPFFIGN